jgi:hypothetical protein
MTSYRILISRTSPRIEEVSSLVETLGGSMSRRSSNKGNAHARSSFTVTCSTEDARRFSMLGAEVKVAR